MFLFSESNFMVGGSAHGSITPAKALRIDASGEHWISAQVQIREHGYYELTVDQDGKGLWDILIDGEQHKELQHIRWDRDGRKRLPLPIYLETGFHSLIFYSRENLGSYQWRYCQLGLYAQQPARYLGSQSSWQTLTPYSRTMKIGRMFSGNYINVNIARDMALLSRNGYQYVSYFNPEGFLVVARRGLNASYFEKYWLPIRPAKAPLYPTPSADFSLYDPHNYVSMQMDGAGYIHLAYGQHNNRLR